jgi:hypothetical protein
MGIQEKFSRSVLYRNGYPEEIFLSLPEIAECFNLQDLYRGKESNHTYNTISFPM